MMTRKIKILEWNVLMLILDEEMNNKKNGKRRIKCSWL